MTAQGRRPSLRAFGAWIALLSLLLLPACSGRFAVDTFAEEHGFGGRIFAGDTFDLQWYLRGAGDMLRVYVEGDGLAWLNRRTPSTDPTPRSAVAFELAASDDAPAVAYLARPCQFTEGAERRSCDTPFWTSARFSEPVVSDMSALLDRAKSAAGAHRLELVGYSGGGAVALLLAARRDDVSLVVTVAGNLDHAFWTGLHGVSPLRDSLNPADFAGRLRSVPQIHIVGADDEVVPPAVARSYVGRMVDAGNVRIVTVSGVGHTGDWSRALSDVLGGLR